MLIYELKYNTLFALNDEKHLINFIISHNVFVFPWKLHSTVLPAKSDSDFLFCLQSYQGLIIDRALVY